MRERPTRKVQERSVCGGVRGESPQLHAEIPIRHFLSRHAALVFFCARRPVNHKKTAGTGAHDRRRKLPKRDTAASVVWWVPPGESVTDARGSVNQHHALVRKKTGTKVTCPFTGKSTVRGEIRGSD